MKHGFPGLVWWSAAVFAAQSLALRASDPAVVGQWSSVLPWPAVAIHTHLLKTGKVLSWQTGPTANLWDPATGVFTSVPNPWVDLLCAGNTFLPDGRLITLGGWDRTSGLGLTEVDLFDPTSLTWSRARPMTYKRWYPTGTVLPDGRILATSGDRLALNDIAAIPEIYDPAANTWTSVPQAANAIPVYPFMYVRPDGRLISVGNSEVAWDTEALDLAAPNWTVLDSRVVDGGSVAMFQPGKFMKAGSASDDGNPGLSVATAFVFDLTQLDPAWRPTASMAYPRSFLNLTVLPDGNVLCTGGGTDKTGYDTNHAVLTAEMWSPAAETWTTLASMRTPRLYHSTALLLPDARVLAAGGGGDPGVVDQPSGEIFSPPYLFKGSRPAITAAPSALAYGSDFVVTTPDASSLSSVSLISLGSVTHSFNQNQRFLNLGFRATAGGITVTAPANSSLAPPGYYLLFLVNSNGVPSVGTFVNLPVPSPPPLVVVPNVVTLTRTGATTAITNAGLVVGIATSAVSQTVPSGSVVSQSPTAGAQAALGSGVDLVVSSGPPPPGPVVDKVVFSDGNGTRVTSPFSTSWTGEILVAFAASDGPASGQSLTVSGAGLTWTLVKRANTQLGTAEIWKAAAATVLSNVTVSCAQSAGGFDQSLTVVAFTGAGGIGAAAAGGAASGAPSVSLMITKASSVVYGVGNDYDAAIARGPGANQVIVHQWVDGGTGDTFWVQAGSDPITAAGTSVPINDLSPTTDRWNLAAVEIVLVPSPFINSCTVVGGQLVLRGTGPTNAPCTLLMGTNCAQPLAAWTPVAANAFNALGQFSFTNASLHATPRQLYRLRTP